MASDRRALLTNLASASTNIVLARLLVNWVNTPLAIWLLAVALLAAGVAGTVLRWPTLAWTAGRYLIWRRMVSSN